MNDGPEQKPSIVLQPPIKSCSPVKLSNNDIWPSPAGPTVPINNPLHSIFCAPNGNQEHDHRMREGQPRRREIHRQRLPHRWLRRIRIQDDHANEHRDLGRRGTTHQDRNDLERRRSATGCHIQYSTTTGALVEQASGTKALTSTFNTLGQLYVRQQDAP